MQHDKQAQIIKSFIPMTEHDRCNRGRICLPCQTPQVRFVSVSRGQNNKNCGGNWKTEARGEREEILSSSVLASTPFSLFVSLQHFSSCCIFKFCFPSLPEYLTANPDLIAQRDPWWLQQSEERENRGSRGKGRVGPSWILSEGESEGRGSPTAPPYNGAGPRDACELLFSLYPSNQQLDHNCVWNHFKMGRGSPEQR